MNAMPPTRMFRHDLRSRHAFISLAMGFFLLAMVSYAEAGEVLFPGLYGEYFRLQKPAKDFPVISENQMPALKRIDKSINFADTRGPFPGTEFENLFFVRWTGNIRITEDNAYTFHLEADDDARLFIDGALILDVRQENGKTTGAAEVELKSGDHDIRVDYVENNDTAGCRLLWESSSFLKQVVPRRVLFHAEFEEDEEPAISGTESVTGEFASPDPETAEANRRTFMASGVNGLAKVILSSGKEDYPSWLGTLPLAFCRQTDGVSTLAWQTELAPEALNPNAYYKFRVPVAMGFQTQPAGGFQFNVNGLKAFDFDVILENETWKSPLGEIRASYCIRQLKTGEDSNGELVIEIKGTLLKPGEPVKFEVTGSASESLRWFGVYLLPETNAAATSPQP
jgi:hypothetical protein